MLTTRSTCFMCRQHSCLEPSATSMQLCAQTYNCVYIRTSTHAYICTFIHSYVHFIFRDGGILAGGRGSKFRNVGFKGGLWRLESPARPVIPSLSSFAMVEFWHHQNSCTQFPHRHHQNSGTQFPRRHQNSGTQFPRRSHSASPCRVSATHNKYMSVTKGE